MVFQRTGMIGIYILTGCITVVFLFNTDVSESLKTLSACIVGLVGCYWTWDMVDDKQPHSRLAMKLLFIGITVTACNLLIGHLMVGFHTILKSVFPFL